MFLNKVSFWVRIASILILVVTGTLIAEMKTPNAADAASSCTHFVATSGDDNNNGTSASSPFRNIQSGINALSPGDILCVRSGTYFEDLSIRHSGSPDLPITIMAYPGDLPVLDGRAGVDGLNTGLPDCSSGCSSSDLAKTDPISGKGHVWGALVDISGSHIVFDGFEIKRSMGRGITIADTEDVTVRNCDVHHSRHGGILVFTDASKIEIESCKVWWNGEFAPYSRSASTLNWPMIIMIRGQYVTVRDTEVFNNWGEGIGSGRDSKFVTIEGNTVYDNYALQIYVDHAQDVVISRNLTYFSDDPTFYRGEDPSTCIAINNEVGTSRNFTRNIEVTNNIAKGCKYNFGLWSQNGRWGIENLLVAHNTFVDGYSGGMRIADANEIPHQNVRFKNNIILQQSGTPLVLGTSEGIEFSHNLWFPQQPVSGGKSPDDVYDDPRLNIQGSTRAGELVPGYFMIIDSISAALEAALVDEDRIPFDYFSNQRDLSPDIGAIEAVSAE